MCCIRLAETTICSLRNCQCFGKGKNSPGIFDRTPTVISAFALNDLYDQDFGIHDLDLLETVGEIPCVPLMFAGLLPTAPSRICNIQA